MHQNTGPNMTSMAPPPDYTTSMITFGTQPATTAGTNTEQDQYASKIWITAILHVVGGSLLGVWGIVAICILAFSSYFATSIWTGIVIFGLTGLFGFLAANQKTNCMVNAYIGLSFISLATSVIIISLYIVGAIVERYYACYPGKWRVDCDIPRSTRQVVDSLIIVTGFYELAVSIASVTFGCYFTCGRTCCNNCTECCAPTPQPTRAVYNNQGAAIQMSAQAYQQGGPMVIQGGLPSTQNQPVFIIQQTPGPSSVAPPAPAQQQNVVAPPAPAQQQYSVARPAPAQQQFVVSPAGYAGMAGAQQQYDVTSAPAPSAAMKS